MDFQLQNNMSRILIHLLLVSNFSLFGQTQAEIDRANADTTRINAQLPPFERSFGGIISEQDYSEATEFDADDRKDKYCNLDKLNNFSTAITFYGDSRLDLIKTVLFGYANLDAYLRASREEGWNVQNLAQSAATSEGLLKHLSSCYRAQFRLSQMNPFTDDGKLIDFTTTSQFASSNRPGDFRKMQFPNYVTAKNIVFEIGGNDFLQRIPEFIFLPYMIPVRVENTRLNIRNIIALLRRRDRNVLLVGNYPTAAYSLRLGSAKDQLRELKPYVGNYGLLAKDFSQSKSYSLPEIGLFHELILGLSAYYLTQSGNKLPSRLPPILQPEAQKISLHWWRIVSGKDSIFTSTSIAMTLLESGLPGTVDETNLMPYVSDSLSTAYYHSVWNLYVDPRVILSEPWVGNQLLLIDSVHPNAMGFKLWGDSVGEKIRSLGWHNHPKQFRKGDLRDYDILNKPYLTLLQESRNRLNEKLDAIKNMYLDALNENARSQIIYRKTILQGRLNSDDTDISAEIDRLEKERLRILAEAEAARLAAIQAAEQERLNQEIAIAQAAAEEEARQREIQAALAREEQERINRENQANNALLLLLLCFYTGHCR